MNEDTARAVTRLLNQLGAAADVGLIAGDGNAETVLLPGLRWRAILDSAVYVADRLPPEAG